jgi:hypothetical protein
VEIPPNPIGLSQIYLFYCLNKITQRVVSIGRHSLCHAFFFLSINNVVMNTLINVSLHIVDLSIWGIFPEVGLMDQDVYCYGLNMSQGTIL